MSAFLPPALGIFYSNGGQKMTDNRPHWVPSGQYGYWIVQETRPGEPGHATYGDVVTGLGKRNAERVAAALNSAYSRGRKDAGK